MSPTKHPLQEARDPGANADQNVAANKAQRRVTKMMAIVMGSYYLLYTPAIINEYIHVHSSLVSEEVSETPTWSPISENAKLSRSDHQ